MLASFFLSLSSNLRRQFSWICDVTDRSVMITRALGSLIDGRREGIGRADFGRDLKRNRMT